MYAASYVKVPGRVLEGLVGGEAREWGTKEETVTEVHVG